MVDTLANVLFRGQLQKERVWCMKWEHARVERSLKFIYGEFPVDNMDGMEYARLVLWPLT